MRRTSRRSRDFTVRVGSAPTRERRRQNGGVVAETIQGDGKAFVRRYRAVWECPLDAYRDLGIITDRQHRAGLRFRQAYYNAVLRRKVTHDRLNRRVFSIARTYSERVLTEAYHLLSSHYKGAVIDICGHDQPARDMAKLVRLQKGLGQLAMLWQAAEAEILGR